MLRATAPVWQQTFTVCLALLAASIFTSRATADPTWAKLVPFKKIDADPGKSYEIEENHGPWMIMAASFVGPTAEQQSQELVLELRQRFRLEAFIFRHTYDFS